MHKTNKCFYYIFLALFIQTNVMINGDPVTDNAIISTYQGTNGPWKYLEYLFITKPNSELNNYIESHVTIPVGIVGAIILSTVCVNYFNAKTNTSAPVVSPNDRLNNIVVVGSLVAAVNTVYNLIKRQAIQSIQKKTLLNVLQKWNTYKQNFPISLVEYFDELESLYKTKNFVFTTEVVSEVFELVTHHIEHNFESRYKQAPLVTPTSLESFKNSTEIWKNLG